MGFHSAAATHVIAETMKLMFADRSVAMGDPDFVKIHSDKLLSKEYAKELATKIDLDHAQEFAPTEGIEAREYPGCTTSFSIMDQYGNAFAQTQTIRNWWGCGVVLPKRGFVLNNAMADFSPKVGVKTTQGLAYGEANAVRPGKTPLSSMSPTLVFQKGKPVLAVGCAGGPRIITSVLPDQGTGTGARRRVLPGYHCPPGSQRPQGDCAPRYWGNVLYAQRYPVQGRAVLSGRHQPGRWRRRHPDPGRSHWH